jgi:hypothetical protein
MASHFKVAAANPHKLQKAIAAFEDDDDESDAADVCAPTGMLTAATAAAAVAADNWIRKGTNFAEAGDAAAALRCWEQAVLVCANQQPAMQSSQPAKTASLCADVLAAMPFASHATQPSTRAHTAAASSLSCKLWIPTCCNHPAPAAVSVHNKIITHQHQSTNQHMLIDADRWIPHPPPGGAGP